MIEVPLQALPNQSLSIRLDNQIYDLILKTTNGCMSITLVRDGVTILSNCRVVAENPVIPYRYMESGNFIFTTLEEDLPDWTLFGISQSLIYFSMAELGAIRAGT